MTQLYKQRFAELATQFEQIKDSAVSEHDSYVGRTELDIEYDQLIEWRVKAQSLIEKVCGENSQHFKLFHQTAENVSHLTCLNVLNNIFAVFKAAREDFEGGYLNSLRSLVKAEVFDSELEQAQELLRAGYISAAAVIAGVVLETALRELCDRNGIAHAKLDQMNADLAKAGTYQKLQQKRITALADIRNSAAHGDTSKFGAKDVEDMIRDIERFLSQFL